MELRPGKEYSIAKGYAWLHHSIPDIEWHHQVWNKWTVPKHSIIAWMYHHRGLNTKDKLFRLNIASDNLCCICGSEEETTQHLFFKCQYSKAVLALTREWTGYSLPETRD
ncbi:putative mitochondrial protein AtMg00120 [Silene latifolia]|uniref:putative mitochondrial protein AtMg00120 n=1 Tax=Silene latifolia TaxID=37657 RepID=UPI003D7753AD